MTISPPASTPKAQPGKRGADGLFQDSIGGGKAATGAEGGVSSEFIARLDGTTAEACVECESMCRSGWGSWFPTHSQRTRMDGARSASVISSISGRPVFRLYGLVIASGQARAWTPARQPVWRPALHSGNYKSRGLGTGRLRYVRRNLEGDQLGAEAAGANRSVGDAGNHPHCTSTSALLLRLYQMKAQMRKPRAGTIKPPGLRCSSGASYGRRPPHSRP